MKKLLAITLSVVMLLGCVAFSAVAAYGDTITTSDAVVDVKDDGTTVILLVASSTAVDDSDDTIENGTPLVKGIDAEGYPYFDGVRAGDYFVIKTNVAAAGTYKFALNFACPDSDSGDFTLVVDGETTISVDNDNQTEGWQAWGLTDEGTVELTEGEHELKIIVNAPVMNASAFVIAPANAEFDVVYPFNPYQGPVVEGGDSFVEGFAGGTYDYRFVANTTFDEVSAQLATYGAKTSKCNVSLYKYNGVNLETTLSRSEAIATVAIDPLIDNGVVELPLDTDCEAGEYVLHIDATESETAVAIYRWINYTNVPTGVSYLNGEVIDIIPKVVVNFTQQVEDGVYFGQSEADKEYYPEAYAVSATEATVIGAVENANWYENNLEADEHTGNLTVVDDKIQDFRYGDAIAFAIDVEIGGTYKLSLGHIWAAPSNWTISVDGEEATPVEISATPSDWSTAGEADLGDVYLYAGEHTIELVCVQEDSGQHIISLIVTPVDVELPTSETTTPETTTPETTAPETTAPETTAADTTVADTTVAATTVAATTAAPAEETTAAPAAVTTAATAGTKAPATTTAAAASEGCKAVVGSMSAIALLAVASAAAVVLKKKED